MANKIKVCCQAMSFTLQDNANFVYNLKRALQGTMYVAETDEIVWLSIPKIERAVLEKCYFCGKKIEMEAQK